MRVRLHLRLLALSAWRGLARLYDSDGLTHAASVAYYALLSLFPFVLLMLSLIAAVTADPQDRDRIVDFVFRYFPRQFEFITGQIDAFRASRLRIGVGGTIALVWASLGFFNAVTSAVNHAWGVEKRRSFLRHRLVGFLMFVSAGGGLMIGIAIMSLARMAETRWFGVLVSPETAARWTAAVSARQLATLLFIACVALVFYFIPNAKVRFRDVWPGAILVGLLWRAALAAFSWYARDLAVWNVVHGSVATVVVFLLWIYICAVILVYGVGMTAEYSRLREAVVRHPTLAPSDD